jgi:hypothetical protein
VVLLKNIVVVSGMLQSKLHRCGGPTEKYRRR